MREARKTAFPPSGLCHWSSSWIEGQESLPGDYSETQQWMRRKSRIHLDHGVPSEAEQYSLGQPVLLQQNLLLTALLMTTEKNEKPALTQGDQSNEGRKGISYHKLPYNLYYILLVSNWSQVGRPQPRQTDRIQIRLPANRRKALSSTTSGLKPNSSHLKQSRSYFLKNVLVYLYINFVFLTKLYWQTKVPRLVFQDLPSLKIFPLKKYFQMGQTKSF